MKFIARIGKTRYELEETSTPQVLKVTKLGPGEQTFFLPRCLIVDYVCHKVEPRTADHVMRDLGK